MFYMKLEKKILKWTTVSLLQMIMFLSKSDEEIKGNKKLAQAIIDKWVIFFLRKRIFFNSS